MVSSTTMVMGVALLCSSSLGAIYLMNFGLGGLGSGMKPVTNTTNQTGGLRRVDDETLRIERTDMCRHCDNIGWSGDCARAREICIKYLN